MRADGVTCVIQHDSRRASADGDESERRNRAELMANTQARCDADPRCAYVAARVFGESGDETSLDAMYPPYWTKVFAMRRALEMTEPRCARAAWLDADATTHDARATCRTDEQRCETTVRSMSETIDGLFDGGDFFYSRDPGMNPEGQWWDSAFNAGVFGAANTEGGREVLDAWGRLYPVDAWSLGEDGRWHTTSDVFGGPAYEQGAFASGVLDEYRARGALREVDSCVINTPCESFDEASIRGAATCHFAGLFKKIYLEGYLKSVSDASASLGAGPGTYATSPARLRAAAATVSEPFAKACAHDLASTGLARSNAPRSNAPHENNAAEASPARRVEVDTEALAGAAIVVAVIAGAFAASRRRRRAAADERLLESTPLV